jgi:hypothetical protein
MWMTKRTYRLGEVAEKIGLPAGTIHNWQARGLIDNREAGKWTRFSYSEVQKLYLVAGLLRAGLTLRAAFELAPEILRNHADNPPGLYSLTMEFVTRRVRE